MPLSARAQSHASTDVPRDQGSRWRRPSRHAGRHQPLSSSTFTPLKERIATFSASKHKWSARASNTIVDSLLPPRDRGKPGTRPVGQARETIWGKMASPEKKASPGLHDASAGGTHRHDRDADVLTTIWTTAGAATRRRVRRRVREREKELRYPFPISRTALAGWHGPYKATVARNVVVARGPHRARPTPRFEKEEATSRSSSASRAPIESSTGVRMRTRYFRGRRCSVEKLLVASRRPSASAAPTPLRTGDALPRMLRWQISR